MISGGSADTKLSAKELSLVGTTMSGCPMIEAVDRRSSGGGLIETKAGAPFTSLGGLLLKLGLGNHLGLQLLNLHGLSLA